MLGVIIDECDWQDGKKGFNESDDEDDDDEDDFDGIFGDGAGSFLKASQDCLASQSEVGFISVTYWVTVMDRVILFIANSFHSANWAFSCKVLGKYQQISEIRIVVTVYVLGVNLNKKLLDNKLLPDERPSNKTTR